MKKRLFFTIFFTFFVQLVYSQTDTIFKEIEIINANEIYHTKDMPEGVNILLGEVELYHDSATMYCDSAILIQKLRKFNAYGNVHIIKIHNNDTIQLWGDTLFYDGILKKAKIRNNVVLNKDTTTLYTDSLDFDLVSNIGYYFNWGLIINGQDSLTSKYGFFYSNRDEVIFKDSATIINPRFRIFTPDSLKHNLREKISYFYGPTQITSDTNYLYAEFGWYNHKLNLASISKNAYFHSGEHELYADSIFYNRNTGLGQGFKNVKIIDTIQDIILLGNYGEFNEKNQKSLMTDSALFLQIYEGDTLYLHSDTMFSYIDTIFEDIDTLIFRKVFAYHHVKAFRKDFQLKCDSLVFSATDSVFKLYKEPILWSDSSQITANYIELYIYNSSPDEIFFYDSVFFSQMIDSVEFNQVKCQFAHGWFKKGNLNKMLTLEKIKILYFIKDEKNNQLITLASLQTDTMWIYFKDNRVSVVVPIGKTSGTLHPPREINDNLRYLQGFKWYDEYRPKKPQEVFIWRKQQN